MEDNSTTRKMFCVALTSAGYEVVEAGDARTALDIASHRRPDLIVQDLALPDMDGLDLLHAFRKQPGGASIPIFCVSGFLSKRNEARAEDEGFTVVLFKPVDPIHLIELVRGHLVAMSAAPDASIRGQRILLVDDDPLQLKLTHVWLANSGFDVLTATDGASAQEEARRHRPDAIVSDILMPGTDGFALCLAVRHTKETESIPVVLTSSSYIEESDRALAERVGASVLVAKTEGLDALVQAISTALRVLPPPSPRDSLDTINDEHAKRTVWQLERQVRQNAHLVHRSNLQAARLAVLASVSEALASNRTLDGVLGEVLASCLDMAGISKGVLYLTENDGRLAFKHQTGFSETEMPTVRRVFDCEDVIRDIARRGNVTPVPSPAVAADCAQTLSAGTQASPLLVVPVVWADTIYGAVILGTRPADDISHEDALAFARVLGAQIGQALGLSHAFASLASSEEALRISREELRRLSAHNQKMREEEKTRIARELHDDLGQQLTALKMAVTLIERKNDAAAKPSVSRDDLYGMYESIDQLVDSVRRIAGDLRPVMLDDLGLTDAIEWMTREFSSRYRIRVISHVDADAITFNEQSRIEVFRMVQEALTNVARHSGATEVVLDIVRDDPHCIVRIIDNGRGAQRDARSDRHSFGLLGISERAVLLGGEIDIRTAPGSGFALTAILPLAAVEARAEHG
ncbi:response regulator [Trinickia acidisoli]|uniref:response regulator n=1 Tax=Trinickia acidisoli TaxID=2767482 RepID=UPI001A8C5D17